MAAAGSAVGLGNIWRFPYLAAKDGGGLFLVVYIALALTFGFALLVTEIAIGRKTKQSSLTAYGHLRPKWKWLGVIECIIPVIIMPYYCAIGGWVLKYTTVYTVGGGEQAARDGFFNGFISGSFESIIMMAVFLLATAFVVYKGVNKGIEKTSKVLMPALLVLVIVIAVFSLTISYTDESGVTRTGMEGLGKYVIPDLSGITLSSFLSTLLDAMGQLFFSLSVAMGILITYGSYLPDDVDLMGSVNRIEICDTLVAFLAGVMIIPAVFTFAGSEGMAASGPGLMFVTMPKVFSEMGGAGHIVGLLFFLMVLFAALTSAISIMEAVVSSLMDRFGMSRKKAVIIETLVAFAGGTAVCLGYNLLYFELPLPNGTTAQILDVMDYASNNLLMPLSAIGMCIFIGWVVKPKLIIDEVEKTGGKMSRKLLYITMVKYIAPVMLAVLFIKSIGI